MNKEIYETPVTEIIRFETEDVITTSAGSTTPVQVFNEDGQDIYQDI